ncbi:alpha/beta hydrolase fold domain-containing protein [Mucilaginibacter sp. E4BP6]|uniref:alpha/beta hydrolase n=1 Tax=Mucilaginibacter sp. E4BP6 TaxID=2723089 RepID=UPI0015CB00E8|nr:alpha/beta hydrolase [Mucilaginibacter sp. E4BP6]NYE67020.1 acetyl esterase/lipase [Mucilaginibacter sp. E4BP6]
MENKSTEPAGSAKDFIAKNFQFATSVRSGDTSTSIVIHPDPNQPIINGKVTLTTFENVLYRSPKTANTNGRSLFMDIQVPITEVLKPLILFASGGGFIFATKENNLDLRTYLAEAGFVVASAEYRTVRDGVTYKEGIADLKSAIRFLRSNARQYGIDPTNVGVWGVSSGAYLLTMVAVTNCILWRC